VFDEDGDDVIGESGARGHESTCVDLAAQYLDVFTDPGREAVTECRVVVELLELVGGVGHLQRGAGRYGRSPTVARGRVRRSDHAALWMSLRVNELDALTGGVVRGKHETIGVCGDARRYARAMPNSRGRLRLREPVAPRLPSRLTRIVVPEQSVGDNQGLSSLELHGRGCAGLQAEDVEVNRCRFIDAQIPGVILRRARLEDVEMIRCDLANVPATLNGVVFENCRLTGTQFSQAQVVNARFSDCDLSGVGGVESLRGATVSAADAQSLVWALASAFGIRIED
jgi:hypothetical protein